MPTALQGPHVVFINIQVYVTGSCVSLDLFDDSARSASSYKKADADAAQSRHNFQSRDGNIAPYKWLIEIQATCHGAGYQRDHFVCSR